MVSGYIFRKIQIKSKKYFINTLLQILLFLEESDGLAFSFFFYVSFKFAPKDKFTNFVLLLYKMNANKSL